MIRVGERKSLLRYPLFIRAKLSMAMGTWYISNIYIVTGTIQEKDPIQSMNSFISIWSSINVKT